MADENGGGNSGSWFLNFKPILLIILAGTVFLGQIPYQNSRPTGKSQPPLFDTHEVEARQWQDPFEAVKEHLAKHKDDDGKKVIESVDDFRRQIKAKVIDNGFKELNVIAVMLPGDTYFEEGEIRRRIRYAVLSGFYTALEYMSEENNHIYYFQDNGKTSDQGVAFEWMVYKPVDNNEPPIQIDNNDKYSRKYQRPPVLVLWLKNENFTDAPHNKLMSLLESIKKEQKGISLTDMAWKVNVIGPYDSDNLQSLVNETLILPNQGLKLSDNCCSFESYLDLIYCKNEKIYNVYCEASTINNNTIHYFSASATLQDGKLLLDSAMLPNCTLRSYFDKHFEFQRITTTDENMAYAIAKELKLRGIAPSKDNRVVLIGERDTLYGWHLPKTYETVLPTEGEPIQDESVKTIQNENCKPIQDKVVYFCNKDDKGNKTFEDKCIFKFSYLRGLDGEKSNSKSDSNKAKDDKKDTADKSTSISKMEEADDDSQFDYVRRMVGKIRDLDQQLRQSSFTPDRHVIKAIGILGSDVYDKLLIMQAIHEGFPDAVVFTNGLDARYLQPDANKWTRNLLMVSGFDLALGPELQGDIPPFRDSRQTAFYLATEMALKNLKKVNLTDLPTADQLEKYLRSPNVYELGKTKIIPLSQPNGNPSDDKYCKQDKLQAALNPNCSKLSAHDDRKSLAFGLFVAVLLFVSWVFKPVGELFKKKSGVFSSILLLGLESYVLLFIYLWLNRNVGFISLSNLLESKWFIFIMSPFFYVVFIFFTLKLHEAKSVNINGIPLVVLHYLLVILIICLPIYYLYNDWLGSEEPRYWFEGVSMWPTEGLRFIALIAASYLIIRAYQFPYQVKAWIKKDFSGDMALTAWAFVGWVKKLTVGQKNKSKSLLTEWQDYETNRWWNAVMKTPAFYVFSFGVLYLFGLPHTPFRGEGIKMLDNILLRGMVVPAFILLLFLVTDAAQIAISLISQLKNGSSLRCICSQQFILSEVKKFKLDDDDTHEWIIMRFIQELSKEVYNIIGYPMIVILVIVLSRSSVFDNWTMPISLNIVIGLSVAYLLYCDYRLKEEADEARKNAIKSLQERSFGFKRGDASQKDKAEQLDRLIDLLKNSDEMVYKTFIERPIFVNSMYILVALLADMASYSWLTKFF